MPDDREIEDTYTWALQHARRQAPRPDELTQVAIDAATDAVVWGLKNYDPTRGGFSPFARAAVRRFVQRAIAVSAARYHKRPMVGELDHDHESGETVALDHLADLPDEERYAVRLFYVDQYDLRECGLLMGLSMETVRQRLARAGRLLNPDGHRPARRNGEKRMTR